LGRPIRGKWGWGGDGGGDQERGGLPPKKHGGKRVGGCLRRVGISEKSPKFSTEGGIKGISGRGPVRKSQRRKKKVYEGSPGPGRKKRKRWVHVGKKVPVGSELAVKGGGRQGRSGVKLEGWNGGCV